MTHDAVESLAAIPAFAGLDASLLEAIAQATILRSFDAGQVVFLEGERCVGLYVVQEGWLKAVKISMTGRQQVIRFVGPGEAFNEIGVFAGGLNQATVEALEPAKVWILQRDPLLRLMDEHPPLAHMITQNLAQRVLHLMSLVEDLSLRTVVARLARVFLEHSTDDVMNRRRWSTQAEMAARLGTVPDVLNRALRSLAEEGLIQIERHQILILDRHGLETKAMLDG
jgi:CRP/FNR family transcriptional regulator